MQTKRPFLSRTPEQLFGEDHPVTKAIQKKVGRNVPRTVWKIVKPSDTTNAIHLQKIGGDHHEQRQSEADKSQPESEPATG